MQTPNSDFRASVLLAFEDEVESGQKKKGLRIVSVL
jgi:hypothetical protein